MGQLNKEVFVCVDCETTGLDTKEDRIVEVAAARFTLSEIQDSFESLIDPEREISEQSLAIHKITPEMISGKPKIEELLPELLKFLGRHTIVGHGVRFDIELITEAAKRAKIPCTLGARPFIDTLRLARHYGDSPNNSLSNLALHFNIPREPAHRAMNDVKMNIEVFDHLVRRHRTTEQLFKILDHPIKMKFMPLGKHKGRSFSEIPLQYLLWAAGVDFDQDLLYSIRAELKRRKTGKGFAQATNPFSEL
ncbi:MAG: DNA polymerase III PolC-type [Chlamydiae bacterium]|nr:DNA polymerase III PolC-type [Chlamydiota bacterium]